MFIVNDGMGGLPGGEVASDLAMKILRNLIEPFPDKWNDEAFLIGAFRECADVFKAVESARPFIKYMATTVTMALVQDNSITALHLGDSRIYHFRDGQILWQTVDHTVENGLIERGVEMTPKLRESLGEKLAIMEKAMTSVRKVESFEVVVPSIHVLTDLQRGDTILLCTDGVTKVLADQKIARISGNKSLSGSSRVNQIVKEVMPAADDNFSGYLLVLGEA